MRADIGWHRHWLGAAALLAVSVVPLPAAAHAPHRHHILRPPAPPADAGQDTGFGPTAPGVSAIVIDAASGQVITAIGADIPRYPASLTKLMVLDLAFQALRDHRMTLDTQIPVSEHAAAVEPVKLGLRPGDTITVEQAILSMTTMSANDAATALGEYLGGGSEYRCGQIMTLRAHSLGMAQTEFFNASGLPNPDQISTARDLAILARDIVVSYPDFQSFFEVQKFDFNGHMVYSNNQMLKLYPGATGLKTGYTTLAKHNLITSADRFGRTLIGVVLHEPSWGESYGQMTALLDQGFGAPTAADGAFLSRMPSSADIQAPPAPTGPLLAAVPQAAPPPVALANPRHPIAIAQNLAQPANWTAQIGLYTKAARARSQAIAAAHLRGVGIPRVARIEQRGKLLWTAQLAGLTQTAAHETCSALAARRTACTIIPPQPDHLAAASDFDG